MLKTDLLNLIAEIIFGSLVQELIIPAIKQKKLSKDIAKIVLTEFESAFKALPNYDSLDVDKNFERFFENQDIKSEISKLLKPNENLDTLVLINVWEKCYGPQDKALLNLAFKNFVTKVENALLQIPEYIDIQHYKEDRRDLAQIHTKLDKLGENISLSLGHQADELDSQQLTSKEERYQERFLSAKQLLENNRPCAALDLLLEIERKFAEEGFSFSFQAKILNLIGNSYLVTKNFEKAEDYYERAIKLDPENYKFLANASLAKLNLTKYEEAVKLANQSNSISKNDIAVSVITEVRAKNNNYLDLEEIIDLEFMDNPVYLFTLSSVFYKARHYDKAIDFIERYLASRPDDVTANLFLAQIIIDSLLPEKWSHAYELAKEGPKWQDLINKALSHSKKALDTISAGDNESLKIEVQQSLAAALLIIGKLDQAEIYLDEILRSNPDHQMALHNRIIIAIFKQDYKSGLDDLDKLPEDYIQSHDFYAMAARLYIGIDEPQKALDILDKIFCEGIDEPNFYVMYGWANDKLGTPNWFDKTKSFLMKTSQMSESNKHETLASILVTAGKKEEAINELKLSLASESQSDAIKRVKLRLAHLYFDVGNYEEAISYFEDSQCDLLADPHIARLYIFSLFKSGEYGKTYKLCKEYSQRGYFDPVILDIQGRIAEYLSDFSSAINVEQSFISKNIDPDLHKAHLARLHFRDREMGISAQILKDVNFANIDDPFVLIQCSQLYLLLEEFERALEIALKAYIDGQDSAEINLAYLGVFLRVDEKISFDKKIIQPDTAFLIEDGQDKKWIKVIDVYEPNIRANEYSVNSDIGKRYLGHQRGDEICLKESEIESLSVKILDIQSIFVRTFQEIAENFSSRFPSINAFHRIKISREDPSQFFLAVARMGIHLEMVLNLNSSRRLSIEQLSYLANRSLFDLFLILQSNPPYKVFASDGNFEKRESDFKQLDANDSITITYSGLLTASLLGLLEYLPKVFNKIYVSQYVIEEIGKELDNQKFLTEKGSGSAGYFKGVFTLVDIPEETRTQKVIVLESMLDFVDEYCDQVPISEDNSDVLKDVESANEFLSYLGRLTEISLAIAKQTNSILFSDELIVRKKAQEMGINSFWTETLLLFLKSNKIIEDVQFSKKIASLISLNYFTPILNADIIYRLICNCQYQVFPEVRILLSGLSSNDIDENYAINIASDLIAKIWLESIPQENRYFLQDSIFRALLQGRKDKVNVYKKLERLISSKMALLPKKRKIVIENLHAFMQLTQ